eukprot:CAMPEP_0196721192 /NCGR_PEP_ID=MMETSP1091-20130531/3843_1 /TAXON_ID=302021 /ORGANISM="Rhodomonas sp., Strain CCMP768" /LENGTH=75 /DNA_ID=CAMNT_0042062621 /DNA_START=70 /DNA_END=297 /DNA_ORIENTATION=-
MFGKLSFGTAAPSGLPVFNNGTFNSQFQQTMDATSAIVQAAAKAGQKGESLAVKSMKSVLANPCEESPAPGCVTP